MSSPSVPGSAVSGVAYEKATQVNIANLFGNVALPEHISSREPLRQLPARLPDFAGRTGALRAIEDLARETVVINIYGMPGVGKSALAVHAAHHLAKDLTGHQLYVDLRAIGANPIGVDAVLKGILVSLGLPVSELPTDIAVLAAIFRSQLASQPNLILIDNATNAEPLQYLFPGDSRSRVLITSRSQLAAVPGIRSMRLRDMSRPTARSLLVSVSGREILPADEAFVSSVIDFCDGLPLALRIAGGTLRTKPLWSWSKLAGKLGDSRKRLKVLQLGHLTVRSSFQLSYDELDPALARAFRYLALAPSRHLSTSMIGALMGDPPDEAEDVLEELADHQLLRATSRGYGMHDLMRLFAAELLTAEPTADVDLARERLASWYSSSLTGDYLNDVAAVHEYIAPLWNQEPRRIADVYVDIPLRPLGRDSGSAMRAATLLAVPRFAVIAAGGAGKTTLVNRICTRLAERVPDFPSLFPFVIYARDLTTADLKGDFGQTIVRTVRSRYDYELNDDSLAVALVAGALLVIDGLDEVSDGTIRRQLLAAVNNFADRWPATHVLVTSREYADVGGDLDGYQLHTFADLTLGDREEIIRRLFPQKDRLLRHRHRQGTTSLAITPLGVVLAASTDDGDGSQLQDEVGVMETLMRLALTRRDYQRTVVRSSQPTEERDQEARLMLERIAFWMQCQGKRIYISERDIVSVAGEDGFYISHVLAPQVFGEAGLDRTGQPFFGFTHTAYREHLAASYLGRRADRHEFMATLARAPADASWETVLATAVRLRAESRGRSRVFQSMVTLAENDTEHRPRILAILRRAAQPTPSPNPILRALTALGAG